jgi:hypothetical protein
MNEGKSNRLMLAARLVALVTLYVASITLLSWVGVRFGWISPSLAIWQTTLLIIWPTSGCIRYMRQLQAESKKSQFVHEGILLAGLSLVIATCLLLSAGKTQWLLSVGISIWSFTIVYLLIYVMFADAISNFLVKHKLATRNVPSPKEGRQ